MNILLCNERFLFRFGVDRVLMLLGHGLKDRGHRISVMANKFDRATVEGFSEKIIAVPEGGDSYLNLNEFTAQWLAAKWSTLFDEQHRPDVVVIGGWPFFAAIPVFERLGCRTIFMDCGAVPLEGFDEGGRITQEKLRNLRKAFLPHVSAVTPISQFIASTQSCTETNPYLVEPILLGADHMAQSLWDANSIETANRKSTGTVVDLIKRKQAADVKVMLNLGRWEPGCYKNSEAIFKLVDEIEPVFPHVSILILADPLQTEIPDIYRDKVIPVGFPDDAELQVIMTEVDLGVSVSLWEGFNLPIAEMQWLGKPVLAFNIGAHPEVVLHPWFLCQDISEMGSKAQGLLGGGGLDNATLRKASMRFRASFSWQSVVDQYERLLERIVARHHAAPISILIDVTNACRDPANSGVIRVTRRLCRELQRYCQPIYVVWGGEEHGYVFPTRSEYHQLSQYNGPVIGDLAPCSPENGRLRLADVGAHKSDVPAWLLLIETVLEVNGRLIRNFAKENNIRIAAVFHDAIPILRPDLVKDSVIRENHVSYMRGLSECHLVLGVSEYSATCLKQFWSEWGVVGPQVLANANPGEFFGSPRCSERGSLAGAVNLLCVSTLEPRKNHRRLMDAVNLFARQHPGVDWSLTLVGNRYAGGEDIAEFVESACRDNVRIQWLGIVDDARLHQAYKDCTFTIYASEIEGFGMPILESIWHGKPCICHEQGVMSELATGGGCLTADVTDLAKLASAIGELATNKVLYKRLVNEATTRPIKTWQEYAGNFWDELIKHTSFPNAMNYKTNESQNNIVVHSPPVSWQEVLYPGCLTKEWQMNDSERLGLAGVLQRLQPECAIEIGTFRGGSLSLIAQFSKLVFSIDIDPSIPEKFKQFSNVSFFTGPSQIIMPTLLQELDSVGMPVEFVLIDGDHSAAGVKRDIDIMLDYVPKRPLIIMMHDGFNPECRRGMMEADWQKSPYVHYVDLDFIPGRVIEHGGGGDGEMWGGLAIAYFSPEKRIGNVDVGATARRTYAESKERIYG